MASYWNIEVEETTVKLLKKREHFQIQPSNIRPNLLFQSTTATIMMVNLMSVPI